MMKRSKIVAAGVAIAVLMPLATARGEGTRAPRAGDLVSLVRVDTPTDGDKDRLLALGLDVTEHAGPGFVEVVLHGAADIDTLEASGMRFTTEVADLVARDRERVAADRAFAAANPTTALPSGRNAYRTLDDYNAEMAALAQQRPDIVRLIRLRERTVEGRDVLGIEITSDPGASSGKPAFVMLGLHHVREWPSGEHTMEFAHDLVNGFGHDPLITKLVRGVRTLIVPVVNPDGFAVSRTDGDLVDLRSLGEDDPTGLAYTGVVLANPGSAYKRKNCRLVDGVSTAAGACAAPGARYLGVDLNRNYGSLWGGAGASAVPVDDIYRGPDPFSEPETRNIQHLVSTNQVTMLITNHTFSNLVIRPPGTREYGLTPDEPAMAHIGARMAAQNGYANIHGWELYDTTGTTEDWSYLSTGGFGYTFEIGADEFHPPFEEVVAEYLGSGALAGHGNRAAYLIAMEAALDPTYHSVLEGRATAGSVLRLQKTFTSETSPVRPFITQFTDDPTPPGPVRTFADHLETTLLVGSKGRFSWHINPSTRPAVGPRQLPPADGAGEELRTEVHDNTTPTVPGEHIDIPFTASAAEAGARLATTLDWATPDDYDLELYRVEAGGALTQVTSSGEAPGFKEAIQVDALAPGDYIFRVVNFAAVNPAWTLTTTIIAPATGEVIPGQTESWTLTCEQAGLVVATRQVFIERGQVLGLSGRLC